MYRTLMVLAILFTFAVASAQSHYSQPDSRELCLQAMQEFDSLFRLSPLELDSGLELGTPVLLEDELTVFIPMTRHPNMNIMKAAGYGLRIVFHDTLNALNTNGAFMVLMNQGVSVHRLHRWSGRFSFEEQQKLNGILYRSCSGLVAQDQKKMLELLKTGRRTVTGPKALKYKLQLNDSSKTLELIVRNRTLKSRQVFIADLTQWNADTIWYPKYHVGMTIPKKGNPFLKVSAGENLLLRSLNVAHLKPGIYQFRVQVGAWEESWMDYGPTLTDGPPIQIQVKRPWTGISTTNLVEFRVNEGGGIELIAERH